MPFSLFKSVRLLAYSTYQAVQALGSTPLNLFQNSEGQKGTILCDYRYYLQ
jgi:hypothetical protein